MSDDEFQIWAAAFVRALPLDHAGQQAYDAVDRYCAYIKEHGPVRGEPDHAAVARSLWNTSIEARIHYLAGMAAKQHAVIEAARELVARQPDDYSPGIVVLLQHVWDQFSDVVEALEAAEKGDG